MKKITLLMFCLFGVISESKACDPVYTTFNEWLNQYNKNDYIIVEGYFKSETETHYSSKFKVTRSSDPSIKSNQEYEVFEYGPFGSMCEMLEMESSIKSKLTGQENPRLLILYKGRSINGKLVTPIFWDAGVDASNNKIAEKRYDYASRLYISYECITPLDEIWKQILKGNGILEWVRIKE
ncbi:hypothetical protein Q4566_05710 [Tamlana sp. 2_MG-2023]|uniref:hypothetical protein n=1 Tax=unclassified Tamlana TaxID=2614803 RepID=UPI0026E39969|nr:MULTISPECIES: hypothetical protein [unclassified Tamlana]MDO6759690.1 hypothetical protein [Tamlana sp. 2_MG-2023]MDO6791313.1 hypothetical protein [Tamlana sp. 1_MG-2023]